MLTLFYTFSISYKEKTPNFMRVRQSSTPPVEVLCEAKMFIKNPKLFSGKCLRYFTPSAFPRREDPKFHARASIFNATNGSTV